MKTDSGVWGYSGLALLGLGLGIGAFLTGDTLYTHLGALIGVFVATLGIVGTSFSASEMKTAFASISKIYKNQKSELTEMVSGITKIAESLRKEGLIAAENYLETVNDPLFKKGMELVAKGSASAKVKEMIELESAEVQKREESAGRVWIRASGVAQWMGVSLTLIEGSLAFGRDPHFFGLGLLSAFYGLIISQVIFVPWGFRVAVVVRSAVTRAQIAKLGIQGIQDGESPTLLKEKLEILLGKV
ncbi:MAG: hypothetical protein KA715_12400 [Xanthomonadaceae bacterium]|nr:hypothetical protein [Xanthomonadaceae bacterium]